MKLVSVDDVKESICLLACTDPLNVDNNVEECEKNCPYMAAIDKAYKKFQQRQHRGNHD